MNRAARLAAGLRRWARRVADWVAGKGRPPPAGADDRAVGDAGERAAAAYLQARGYRVLERNIRLRGAEADLLCLDPDGRTHVLVEVKAAAGEVETRGTGPERRVDARKIRTLRRLLKRLAARRGFAAGPMRIDVVAVRWTAGEAQPRVRHVLDAGRRWR